MPRSFKDRLGKISSRQRQQALAGSYGRRPRTKLSRSYYDNLRITEEENWFRLFPGVYETQLYIVERDEYETVELPHHSFRRHFDPNARTKYLPCAAGPSPDFDPQPCVGCSKPGVSPSQDAYIYNAVHLAWYHKVPWVKDGQVQMNKKTNEPYFNLEPCEGTGCKMCRTDVERLFGRKGHLTFSYTQKTVMEAKEKGLSTYCKCGNKLDLLGLVCPQCEDTLVDVADTEMTDTDISKARREGMFCNNCHRKMRPVDIFDCDCGDPRQLTIFDVDVKLYRIKTHDNKSVLQVEFNPPGPMDERYAGDMEPYDFAEIFKPPSVEVQKMLYAYNGPITNVPEGTTTENY